MPSGASYWPGSLTWPDSEKIPYPVDELFSYLVPIDANQSGPLATMLGTEAIDSTLLMTVGLA